MKASKTLLAGIVSLACAASASAGTIRLNDATGYLNGTDGDGGAFIVTVLSGYNGKTGGPGGSATSFASFCLEHNEGIRFNHVYDTTIDTGAVNGGVGGGNPDPLSEATALLYATFRNGGLIAGQVIDTSAEVTAIQHAIWYLENEGAGFYTGLAQTFADWALAAAPAGSGNFFGVRVLNLTENGEVAQSQLTLVPLPTAAWMGLGLLGSAAGMTYLRRRSVMA